MFCRKCVLLGDRGYLALASLSFQLCDDGPFIRRIIGVTTNRNPFNFTIFCKPTKNKIFNFFCFNIGEALFLELFDNLLVVTSFLNRRYGSWFLKVNVTITNQYGATREAIAEAYINNTTQRVEDFMVIFGQ